MGGVLQLNHSLMILIYAFIKYVGLWKFTSSMVTTIFENMKYFIHATRSVWVEGYPSTCFAFRVFQKIASENEL